jgi:hypothetical protein
VAGLSATPIDEWRAEHFDALADSLWQEVHRGAADERRPVDHPEVARAAVALEEVHGGQAPGGADTTTNNVLGGFVILALLEFIGGACYAVASGVLTWWVSAILIVLMLGSVAFSVVQLRTRL